MGRRKSEQGQLFYAFRPRRGRAGRSSGPARSRRFSTCPGFAPSWRRTIRHTGRPSIDPELMIRMLILGYVFAIRSERALCREVQVNLAYRWFCGLEHRGQDPRSLGLHARPQRTLPRQRRLPPRVRACRGGRASARLVGGKGFAVDASLIAADANKCRSTPGDEWSHDIDPETASAPCRTISPTSTTQPGVRRATSCRSSSRRPIRRRSGPARSGTPRSSPTPTTISST